MAHSERDSVVVFGEVLFDRFPDGEAVLGGAPFNVAWHLQGFGVRPLTISRIGEDAFGEEVVAAMRRWGMSEAGLQRDTTHPTGSVEVRFGKDGHTFHILPEQAYDFVDADAAVAACRAHAGGVLYHGSLALRHPVSRAALEAVRERLDASVFLDVNLRAPWWKKDEVETWLSRARWAKLNDEELAQLGGAPGIATDSLIEHAEAFRARHALEGLIVTRGAAGAVWCAVDGDSGHLPAVEPERLVDTVGAGDAFSAVTLLGLARGWSWETIVGRGQRFAAAICAVQGATRPDHILYESTLAEWEA